MLTPSDEGELAEAVKVASGPLAIQGGGTRASGRSAGGAVLSVAGLSGITLYEPGALTMVARAGTPLAEIEAALEAEGQMLPFEPYDLRGVSGSEGATTVGGIFATNASGARRVSAGAARDYLLGVRFVDGRGDVISNGGRVMKNVTGYDLVKLMAGSRGTLGVLSEVSFKVLPKPESSRTILLHGLSDHDAVRAMASALTSPFEVSGAIHASVGIEKEPTTMLRVEGFADSVAYRVDQLKARLAEFGGASDADGADSWGAIRAMIPFSQGARGEGGALWSVSLRASDAAGMMADISASHDCLWFYDWGGGRVWVWARDRQAVLHRALQGAAGALGGHATLINGPSDLADAVNLHQPEAAPVAALADGLRRQFDPRGILNPGMMSG